MTTAREQAREAVASTYNAAPIGTNVGLTSLADAASDGWEPIVRSLLEAGDHMARFSDHTESVREWDVVARKAKEALGGFE